MPSRRSCSAASTPVTACAISPAAFATALATPLPCQRSPPSRSSVASNSPVEAPEGTAARPKAPEASTTSTSTVGLPRLSRICLPRRRSTAVTPACLRFRRSLGRHVLLAVFHDEAFAAFRLRFPAGLEILDEFHLRLLVFGHA